MIQTQRDYRDILNMHVDVTSYPDAAGRVVTGRLMATPGMFAQRTFTW